ncbi:MAG: hypothetical protein U1D55_03065 [Phycisphaerae bacterium]
MKRVLAIAGVCAMASMSAYAADPMPLADVQSAPASSVVWDQVTIGSDGTGVVRGPGTTVYRAYPDATQFVYWITGPAAIAFPRQLFDDGDMVCGPGEPGPARITNVIIGRRVEAVGPINFDALVTIWNTANIGGASVPAGSGQLGQFRVAYTAQVQGVYATNVSIVGLPGGGITIPDRDFGVTIAYVATGTTTLLAQQVCPLLHADAVASIGATQNGVAADFDGDGVLESDEFAAFAPPLFTQMLLELIADQIPPPPPPPVPPVATCAGALIDDDAASPAGPLVVNLPIAAGQVKWLRFVLTQDVVASAAGVPSSDTLDVHTDGSALSGAFPSDTVLSLYNVSSGALVGSNDDAPNTPANTNYSALSFGDDTPRLSVPNGIIMGGEDGALSKGEYFVGVSAFPAQTAPCGWRHTSTSTETGTIRVNIMSNLSNTCPGDLNADRVVNESDLGILLSSWQAGACGDLNRDGATNEPDLGILLAHWQQVCP